MATILRFPRTPRPRPEPPKQPAGSGAAPAPGVDHVDAIASRIDRELHEIALEVFRRHDAEVQAEYDVLGKAA